MGNGLTTAQLFQLDMACTPLRRLFGSGPMNGVYLVGTANGYKEWRDVDVRLMLQDDQFDALFAEPQLWSLFCYAWSRTLSAETGLPVDFQVQRTSEANERFGNYARNPLGHSGRRDFAGLGDATPYIERERANHVPTGGAGNPGSPVVGDTP